jgi:agmatinase
MSTRSKHPNLEIDQAFTATDRVDVWEPAFSGALSFMRRRYTKNYLDDAVDVVVSGVPFDLGTTNRPGSRFGPRGIREASAQLAWGTPYWPWNFDPFSVLGVIDWGDVPCMPSEPEEMVDAVEAHATAVLQAGKSLLTFGGDHLIALPVLRAHAKHFGPISLIDFDAHTDTETDCGTYDHSAMFHHAVEEGLIDPDRSVQVGIRTHYDPDGHRFRVLDGDWVQNHSPKDTIDAISRTAGDHRAYLTFDIDCLDPSCAPGTGTPVCGGLTTNQAQQILRGLVDIDLVGMDVVEVAPHYDVSEITSLAAAHLAMEYLCVRAARKQRKSTGGVPRGGSGRCSPYVLFGSNVDALQLPLHLLPEWQGLASRQGFGIG